MLSNGTWLETEYNHFYVDQDINVVVASISLNNYFRLGGDIHKSLQIYEIDGLQFTELSSAKDYVEKNYD